MTNQLRSKLNSKLDDLFYTVIYYFNADEYIFDNLENIFSKKQLLLSSRKAQEYLPTNPCSCKFKIYFSVAIISIILIVIFLIILCSIKRRLFRSYISYFLIFLIF